MDILDEARIFANTDRTFRKDLNASLKIGEHKNQPNSGTILENNEKFSKLTTKILLAFGQLLVANKDTVKCNELYKKNLS